MDIKRHIRSRASEMVGLLRRLVLLESPSQDKKAVDACQDVLGSLFRKAGMKVHRFPARQIGDPLLIELPSAAAAGRLKPLLILAHADTVWPVGQLRKMPFVVLGDKAFGPGALDMKAGLVQAYFALKAVQELKLKAARPIQLFINSAEETGHPLALNLIKKLALKSWAALCLEPSLPGGALKFQRKGRLVVRLETQGKMAHAGSPHLGVNAIEEMARQLMALCRLRRAGTTLNIGQIQGGRKANVVADRASAVLDFRFWTDADKKKILHALRGLRPGLPGARVLYRLESQIPPLERTEASRALFRRASRIAAGLGIKLKGGKTGGGSDASIASSLGCPTLDGLGPDGNGIHSENEHVLLSSLVQRTALLAAMLLEL